MWGGWCNSEFPPMGGALGGFSLSGDTLLPTTTTSHSLFLLLHIILVKHYSFVQTNHKIRPPRAFARRKVKKINQQNPYILDVCLKGAKIIRQNRCLQYAAAGWHKVGDPGIRDPRQRRISSIAKTPNIRCFVAKLHLSRFTRFFRGNIPIQTYAVLS